MSLSIEIEFTTEMKHFTIIYDEDLSGVFIILCINYKSIFNTYNFIGDTINASKY